MLSNEFSKDVQCKHKGFNVFELFEDFGVICPTHCTQHIAEIKSLYPEKYIEGGAGKIIEI